MYRPKNTQDRITHRLKISLGHLKKILTMVEEGQYCIDVLHQMQALREGIKKTEDVVMANHLQTCVADSIKKGNDKKVISEIMKIWTKSS